ncbi:MAG: glycosyltransferase family 2 protein [Bacteroidia bacterium]
MKYPKISIITVCLNDRSGLEKTIESVLSQTFSDYEYIIVDGGSTDGTIDIIKKYNTTITHSVSEKDRGIYHAMNKGISFAKGEYCLFLNAGDFLCDENVLMQVFANKFSSDIIYGNLLYDNGKEINLMQQPEKLTFYYMFTKYLFHPSTLVKRSLFDKTGNYNEDLIIASDYEFLFKAIVIQNATTQYIPIAISQHNNKGISSRPENFDLVMNERKEIHKKYLPKMIIDEMKNLSVNSSDIKMFAALKDHPLRRRLVYLLLKTL